MKKTLFWLVVIALIAFGAYWYATSAPAAPSEDISAAADAMSSASGTVYRISQDSSKVSFAISEMLRGKPFTAVGTTSQIAGDIAVKADSIETGIIKINARTFKTDSSQRDGAIARFILKSDDPANEFIEIAPISAPVKLVSGKLATFQATTTITVSGVSKPSAFSVSVKDEGGKLAIVAETKVKRSDFGLVIPNIPFVASVPDQFDVSAMITAVKQ